MKYPKLYKGSKYQFGGMKIENFRKMKNVNRINRIVIYVGALMSMTSCYDEPDWLGDNTIQGVGSFPVAAFITGNEDNYNENDIVRFQLQYWSDEEIDVINVYSTIGTGERQLESTTPFTPNYSEELDLHLLDLAYPVPAGSSGETITIEVEVVNKNTLTDARSFDFTVN